MARAAVIGWSDGGITALRLAIDHPGRVAGLLAYGAEFDRSGELAAPPDRRFGALGVKYVALAQAEYRRLSTTPDSFPALEAANGAMESRGPAIPPAAAHRARVTGQRRIAVR